MRVVGGSIGGFVTGRNVIGRVRVRRAAAVIVGAALFITSPADALCIYHGVNNAKTTLAQEFRDSRWVVRAHVVSADYHWSDDDDSWTLYRLRVVRSYKGRPLGRFSVFTFRDSGGFYMDGDGAVPDLDGDYLLFLVARTFPPPNPIKAAHPLEVNYNCGQSRRWSDVRSVERARLATLTKARRKSP